MALALLRLFSFLVLLPILAAAQTVGNVTVGASLSAVENSSWISPSGDFAFGFNQLNNKDLFLLAIWYNKIPEKTIVWYANGERPAPRGSRLLLTADRGFVLTSPQGEQLWNTETINGVVRSGVLDDTGNLMLRGSNSILWESFKNPADTMLPSQKLDKGVALSSRQSDSNFTEGRFRMVLQSDGNLVLTTINLPSDHFNEPYYKSDTAGDFNSSSPGFQVVFNESGYLFVLRENEERFLLTTTITGSAKNFYYRATLNFDGIFSLYSHPKASTGNSRWTTVWSNPDNICTASLVTASSGVCGFNSICSLNAERRPNCGCPRGYTLVDPNDQYGSCKPNFTQSCEEEPAPVEDLYDFEVLTNVDWPLADYALLEPFTEEKCRESCLHDCMCAVAIFRLGDRCWKKKLPLSNGRVDPSLDGAKALLKVRKGDPPPLGPYFPNQEMKKKNQESLILALLVILGSSVIFNCIFVAAICLGFYFIYQKKLKTLPQFEGVVGTNLRSFTYKELVYATNEFKEELGRGAFGIVYKGALDMSSSSPVAVKRLNTMVHDTEKEFKTEVNVIGQTHHKNLVRLLGFCDDGDNRLLVYEYLSNGTLASFLFGDSRPSWSQRTQIAFGIARGLLYLHEECSTQIIHCDIKPQNILLDEHYNAKISDFGLAKLLLLNQSHTNTAIRGTKGYVAPEWFRNLPITVKIDVYSFGVVLLELTCCRRSVDRNCDLEERAILTDWAYDCYREGILDALVENDTDALNDRGKVERFVQVAIWCIQEDPSLRPTMRKATQMLEGVVEVPIPPCPYTTTVKFSL
ncbi:CCHC-type integrase, putative [Theobroma cacao]|uniref:Receptor-like serine/threonine-protein kinase n=1 Tax=Theobroma cacao TaxID=3641 RepID=A0A061GSK0_THECC|nr:CCHC-type integrase, putative [Theobroma cacao]